MHPDSFASSNQCLPGTCDIDRLQRRHCFHQKYCLRMTKITRANRDRRHVKIRAASQYVPSKKVAEPTKYSEVAQS